MRLAKQVQNIIEPGSFLEARVTGVCDGVYGLSCQLGQLTARRAVSCLLEPAAGDSVLTAQTAENQWYVLAILTRGVSMPVVSLPADSVVKSVDGNLTIVAQGELALAAGERTSLTTAVLDVRANQAQASFSLLRTAAGLIESTATRVRNVADMIETVADCIRQRAGSMYREVKDLDHLKAGQVYYKAESVFNIRGKHSVLSAEGEVKIDGTRVHLG